MKYIKYIFLNLLIPRIFVWVGGIFYAIYLAGSRKSLVEIEERLTKLMAIWENFYEDEKWFLSGRFFIGYFCYSALITAFQIGAIMLAYVLIVSFPYTISGILVLTALTFFIGRIFSEPKEKDEII